MKKKNSDPFGDPDNRRRRSGSLLENRSVWTAGKSKRRNVIYVTLISEINGDAAGVSNRYAGTVEPQETVEVELESGRSVKEVQVKTGDQVKKGQLLFEYDLSSIQDSLEEAQLELGKISRMRSPA